MATAFNLDEVLNEDVVSIFALERLLHRYIATQEMRSLAIGIARCLTNIHRFTKNLHAIDAAAMRLCVEYVKTLSAYLSILYKIWIGRIIKTSGQHVRSRGSKTARSFRWRDSHW